jgi:hypothetical protein
MGTSTLLRRLDETLAANQLNRDHVEWIGTNDATMSWPKFLDMAGAGLLPQQRVHIHGEGWVIVREAAWPDWVFVSTVKPYEGAGD